MRWISPWRPLMCCLWLSWITAPLAGVTIRHDVPAARYAELGSQFPEVGYLRPVNSGNAFCSGVLVAPSRVLTSAHCFDDDVDGVLDRPLESLVFATTSPVDEQAANNLVDVVLHPRWLASSGQTAFDLALATIADELPARRANLASVDPTGGRGILVGFGLQGTGLDRTADVRSGSEKLAAENRIIGVEGGVVTTDFDHPDGSTDSDGAPTPLALEGSTGLGDSGGPLFADVSGTIHLVGILSSGGNAFGAESTYGDVSEWTYLGAPANQQFVIDQGLTAVPEPACGWSGIVALLLLRDRRGQRGPS